MVERLMAMSNRVGKTFGSLTTEQLNWRVDTGSWSVAQCLDHLISTNELFFPQAREIASPGWRPTFWERHSPLSGLLGRMVIKAVRPETRFKSKAAGVSQPSQSQLPGDMAIRFRAHHDELVSLLARLPESIDPSAVVITSPLLRWATYSLADGLEIMVLHEERHFQQAVRVMESDGFPGRNKRNFSER